jgi:hypothetical protein
MRASVALALISSAASASAADLSFTGSMTGLGVGVLDPACAPLPAHGTVSPDTTAGTSSLGDFTYSHDMCFNPLGGPFEGTFVIDFGIDSFNGTFFGTDSPDAIPGVFDLDWTYTILGGTGRFLDASGTFTGIGTNDGRTRPTPVSLAFNGIINAPAVPEPATWAMMLLGFGAIGFAQRGRRTTAKKLVHLA